jgi:sugar lactone lactonase YvrE
MPPGFKIMGKTFITYSVTHRCSYFAAITIGCAVLLNSLNTSQADILYVSESSANLIRKYDLTTGSDLGIFASTGLSGPRGLAFDNTGNLFVANATAGNIYKFTPDGVGTLFASDLFYVWGLAIDGANNVYVSNPANGSITKITPGGSKTIFFNSSEIAGPLGMTTDSAGNLYAGASIGLRKFAADGTWEFYADPQQVYGNDLKFDGAGNLFATDPNYSGSGTVKKVTPNHQISTFASGFVQPGGLAFDTLGNLYVADGSDKTITKIYPDGSKSFFANSGNAPSFLAVQIVPEPASATIVGFAVTAFLLLRHRKID